MTDIEELRRLLAAAPHRPLSLSYGSIRDNCGWQVANLTQRNCQPEAANQSRADAALIVAAVNALPGLLDEVERAEEAKRILNGALGMVENERNALKREIETLRRQGSPSKKCHDGLSEYAGWCECD